LFWFNQKYFFLFGGLPELTVPGGPEADKGRLGRLITDNDLSPEAMLPVKVDKASAVCGRSGEPLVDSLEELITRVGLGVGLAIELILPDSEWQPRIVELLPSVSDEIIDRGRGITSTCSENPTRGRTPGALSRRRGEDGGVLTMFDIDCRI